MKSSYSEDLFQQENSIH